MKRKFISVFIALVLVLSLSLVTAAPVAAATHQVNPGQSIQAAINTASVGDIIIVTAGTYNEQVVITKNLTLQGAGDTTIIKPSGPGLTATTSIPWIDGDSGTMAAIVSVETTGGSVTIKNLKIDGSLITTKSTTWVAGLVYLETSGKVEGVSVIGNPSLPDRTAGIFAAAINKPSLVEVTGCDVIGYNRAGIYALGANFTANYHHNEIDGPGLISTGVPNGMYFLEGATGSATYNTITDLGYTGETYRSTGIGTYNAGTGITFGNNTISNVQNAFCLSKNSSGTTVEYNTIYNCHTGVRIEWGAANNLIHYNSIRNNTYAIRCDGGVSPSVPADAMGLGNVARYNNFVDNTGTDPATKFLTYVGAVCVQTGGTVTLNAINNWWGHASGPSGVGPGSGGSVSANVLFAPWLTSPMKEPSTVTMTASYIPRIGITVTPTSVDFGSLVPDTASTAKLLTVKNTGNVVEKITATLANISDPDVYTSGLKISGSLVSAWAPANVAADANVAPQPSLVLTVPTGTATGTYTATLVFWAEMP